MTAFRFTRTSQQVMIAIQETLQLNQRELAEFMGVSPRTIIRYYKHGGTFVGSGYEKAARAVHPHDRGLAMELAAHAGKTLVDLGLEVPPAPAGPLVPLPGPASPPRPSPRPSHLTDSIVCVAAEAMQTTPQATRPAVLAAFERAVALGMTAEDVLAAMTPTPKPVKSKS
jgi:hypothetical protein